MSGDGLLFKTNEHTGQPVPAHRDRPIARNTDPDTSHRAAEQVTSSGRRLGQKWKILERLRKGPATNVELAALSLKYTSRISDLRHDGFTIRNEPGNDGVTRYVLEE